jgi:hypothetical protein
MMETLHHYLRAQIRRRPEKAPMFCALFIDNTSNDHLLSDWCLCIFVPALKVSISNFQHLSLLLKTKLFLQKSIVAIKTGANRS